MSTIDDYEDRLDELDGELQQLREKVARLEGRVVQLEDEHDTDKERRRWKGMFGEDPFEGLVS